MLERFLRFAILGAMAALLAACQTAQINPDVAAEITAAGFEHKPDPSFSGATYVCPAARCGAIVVLVSMVDVIPPISAADVTAEQALRANAIKAEVIKTAYVKAIAKEGTEIRMTSFQIVPKAAELRVGFKTLDGSGLTGAGITRMRGNRMGSLLIFADGKSAYKRYLRSNWVP